MRSLLAFAALVFTAACGSGNGSNGGSTDQCSNIASQICQKAVACSAGADAGVVFIIGGDEEAGPSASDFTINDQSGAGNEQGCERFVGLTACDGQHAAEFTAGCSSSISSGLQCGPSTNHNGTGLVLPGPCGQNL